MACTNHKLFASDSVIAIKKWQKLTKVGKFSIVTAQPGIDNLALIKIISVAQSLNFMVKTGTRAKAHVATWTARHAHSIWPNQE